MLLMVLSLKLLTGIISACVFSVDSSNPPDALVVGGTGFMGRHAVQALLDAGLSVEIVTDGKAENPWGPRVSEFVCDRHKPCLVQKLQQKLWDLVVDFPIFDTEDASAIVKSARWIRHYVFPSSDDVYMVCNRTLFSHGSSGGVLEKSAMRPSNLSARSELNDWDQYGDNKKRLEEVFMASPLNFTALRLPDVWGPYESTGRFVTFLRALEHGREIGLRIDTKNPIFTATSSGDTFKPGFVFAKDVAQMILLLLRAGPQNQPLNVAVAEQPTFKEMVLATYHTLKYMSDQRPVDAPTFADSQEVPLLSTDIGPLDISKARDLGFRPTPWKQGWSETVKALFNISKNESLAAAEYAKCVKHCKPTCYCEPTGAMAVYYV